MPSETSCRGETGFFIQGFKSTSPSSMFARGRRLNAATETVDFPSSPGSHRHEEVAGKEKKRWRSQARRVLSAPRPAPQVFRLCSRPRSPHLVVVYSRTRGRSSCSPFRYYPPSSLSETACNRFLALSASAQVHAQHNHDESSTCL